MSKLFHIIRCIPFEFSLHVELEVEHLFQIPLTVMNLRSNSKTQTLMQNKILDSQLEQTTPFYDNILKHHSLVGRSVCILAVCKTGPTQERCLNCLLPPFHGNLAPLDEALSPFSAPLTAEEEQNHSMFISLFSNASRELSSYLEQYFSVGTNMNC